jgi:hypothetical protein
MDRITRTLLALLLPAVLLAGCRGDGERRPDPPAQDAVGERAAPAGEITPEEVRQHQIDMPEIQRWAQANLSLSRLAQSDPELARSMQSEAAPGEHPVDRIERHPEAVRILRENGFSPRQFVVTSVSLMQAMMVAGAMDQNPDMEVPAEVNPANVEVVRRNEAEIQRLFMQMQMEAESVQSGP